MADTQTQQPDLTVGQLATAIRNKYPEAKTYKEAPDWKLVNAWISKNPEREVYRQRLSDSPDAAHAPKLDSTKNTLEKRQPELKHTLSGLNIATGKEGQIDTTDKGVKENDALYAHRMSESMQMALGGGGIKNVATDVGLTIQSVERAKAAEKSAKIAIDEVRKARQVAQGFQQTGQGVKAASAMKELRIATTKAKDALEEAQKLKQLAQRHEELKQLIPKMIKYMKQPGKVLTFKGGKGVETVAVLGLVRMGFKKSEILAALKALGL